MFTIDPSFTHLAIKPERLIGIIQSINSATVMVPGMPSEQASAAIVAWDLGGGRIGLAIHLHYAKLGQAVMYVPQPKQVSAAELAEVTREAIEFLESMGFMLDNPGFTEKSPAEKAALVAEAAAFRKLDKPREGSHTSGAE